jgi:hypothetical protein
MHNANYTKEMNSNEEIFQLEIKSKKFHQRGSFHQERSLNTVPKIMIIILKIMLSINQSISIQCLRKTRGDNSIFLPWLLHK